MVQEATAPRRPGAKEARAYAKGSLEAALELTHGTHGILQWVSIPTAVMPSKYVLYRRQSLTVPFNEVAVGALAG